MEIIQVELREAGYPVYLGRGVLRDESLWKRHLGRGKVLIVSNEVVAPLYLEQLLSALSSRQSAVHILPEGEKHKTIESWSGILDRLAEEQARRDATLIALGGGVVGDLGGFAAASYMRGIRFVQVPTTLLAQVDASVGGKTGVNHARGKNLIGAFHQPSAVFVDTDTLTTLGTREYSAGLAEVVKYGAIMDRALFDWLGKSADAIRSRQPDALQHLIRRSVRNKAEIVAADERESGVRALLNFGHTFGHAMETLSEYAQFLHGEAVAMGMVIAARLSELRGLCPANTAEEISKLLKMLGLPTSLPSSLGTREMMRIMELDKKATAGGLRLILLRTIGEAFIDDASMPEDIAAALEQCRLPQ